MQYYVIKFVSDLRQVGGFLLVLLYNMIQDDNKKAELFNDYFCKQADLNDSETSVPDITDILINGLEQIIVTENEVEDILKILDTSKAIGPDLLNPRSEERV